MKSVFRFNRITFGAQRLQRARSGLKGKVDLKATNLQLALAATSAWLCILATPEILFVMLVGRCVGL